MHLIKATTFFTLFSVCAYAQTPASAPPDSSSIPVFTWRLTALSQCIKPDPLACSVTIEAAANPCVQRIVAMNTTTTVAYVENGRNDSATFNRAWSGNDCRVVIVENLDGKILGGSVAVSASVRLSDGRVFSSQKAEAFYGLNPANDVVRTAIANPTYSVVAYDRSKFKQFSGDGRPTFNKGFGIMSVAAPDAEQVWHWRRNVDAGKTSLDTAWTDAKGYPEKMRKSGYPRIKDFDAKQLRLFALQSLVGELYYVPNANGREWIPNKTKSNYADRMAKIEAEVAAGRPPSDW